MAGLKQQRRKLLDGQRVAFTGRLASMTRPEAARLVADHGGKFESSVTPDTSLLVVGREGWPLDADGRPTKKLRQARLLMRRGSQITIVPEEKFLARMSIGGHPHAGPLPKGEGVTRCDMAQLTALLKVSRDRIRRWMADGLVSVAETIDGIAYFDFAQVAGAKRLCELAAAGVSVSRLRRSLEQLRNWLQEDLRPDHVDWLAHDGRLLLRLDGGQLAEPTGQLRMEFNEQAAGEASLTMERPRSAESWFDEAFELEQDENWPAAAHAYRQVLALQGPSAGCCFNLANVLYAMGQKEAAIERFRQVLELEPEHCDAWNNLAMTLVESGNIDEALSAYRRAIELNPACADAHYNLADALEALGRHEEARQHWSAYLRLERGGPWAEYAQTKLRAGG